MSTARSGIASAGTYPLAFAAGGEEPSVSSATEEWVGVGVAVGAWATANVMNQGRYTLAGASNEASTNALAFGGNFPPGDNLSALTESFNGTNWTEVNDLNTARQNISGNGIYTSALAFLGFVPPGNTLTGATESWNGTNWTEMNDINSGRKSVGTSGVSNTSILAFGGDAFGNPNPTRAKALTESWNGTNWTEVNDMTTARFVLAGAGTQTSALGFGGYDFDPTFTAKTESWNGSNWTEVGDMNSARYNLAGSGANNTAALAIGGTPGSVAKTEDWNGTTWAEVNDLNAGRDSLAAGGTTTASIAFGGTPPVGGQTEEWSVPSSTTKTISTD